MDAGPRRAGSQRAHPTIAWRYRLAAVADQVARGRLDHSKLVRLSSLCARVARRPWQRPQPVLLERARFTLGMPSEANWLVIVSAFGYISLLNLLPNMLLALGEELGWRGFLVPELTTWVGFRRASLYSGAIWGAWHLPGLSASTARTGHRRRTSSCASRSW